MSVGREIREEIKSVKENICRFRELNDLNFHLCELKNKSKSLMFIFMEIVFIE